MRGRGANKCHPIACACTDICSPDALLGSKHFTIIITSSIQVYGWLDSCLLFSCKICLCCKFRTRYLIIFMGGGGSSLMRQVFPDIQTVKLMLKSLHSTGICTKATFFKNNSVGTMIKPLYSSDETSEKLPDSQGGKSNNVGVCL